VPSSPWTERGAILWLFYLHLRPYKPTYHPTINAHITMPKLIEAIHKGTRPKINRPPSERVTGRQNERLIERGSGSGTKVGFENHHPVKFVFVEYKSSKNKTKKGQRKKRLYMKTDATKLNEAHVFSTRGKPQQMERINSISGSKTAGVGTAVVKREGEEAKMHCKPKVYSGHRCHKITVRRVKERGRPYEGRSKSFNLQDIDTRIGSRSSSSDTKSLPNRNTRTPPARTLL